MLFRSCTICVWALAADSEEEAWHLFRSRERASVNREFGIRVPLLSPEEVLAKGYTPAEEAVAERIRKKSMVGNAAQVADKLNAMAAELDLEEMVVVTWTYAPEPRHRSYELLAKQFNLSA